jgi:flavin-dependent thymidylate synthase
MENNPFKMHLLTHTKEPMKAIANACLNLGIGKDITKSEDITYEEAETAFKDTIKSWLTSPLEYASFNFFAQNVPLYIVREWQRARVGWSYAERSMRFYQLDETIIDRIDRRFYPTYTDEQWASFKAMCLLQIHTYLELKKQGVETQDARCVIGVWLPTQLQVAVNYRALRDTLAVRLSSQANPGWQIVAREMKALVTEVDKTLGENLTDMCAIQGRCIWHSKLDRPCKECLERGRAENHVHKFDMKMKDGQMQCSCGMMQSELK